MSEDREFDYIVVGSGAGGGPLAGNLARQGYSVLLLEAGADCGSSYAYRVPAFHPQASEDRAMRWDYFVQHYEADNKNGSHWDSKYCESSANAGGVLYPRAATLGGCTAHNALIALAAYDSDWQRICELTGDGSWHPEHMRAYFTGPDRSRGADDTGSETADADLGFLDWLSTEFVDAPPGIQAFTGKLLQTAARIFAEELMGRDVDEALASLTRDPERIRRFKIRHQEDPRAAWMELVLEQQDPNHRKVLEIQRPGLYRIPLSTRQGERNGPREWLLETARRYPERLTIVTGALVTRICIDDGVAVGVEFLNGSGLYRADRDCRSAQETAARPVCVRARNDTILAAGVFNTPQLLMLSGVGPKEHLESLGIPCKQDLPGVGRNLQDRYEISLVSDIEGVDYSLMLGRGRFRPPLQHERPDEDPLLQTWNQSKSGIYASNGAVLAAIRKSHPQRERPDLFLMGILSDFKGYKPTYSTTLSPAFTWAVLKAYTRNTAGVVRLRSADPLEPPAINFHYFEEGNDSDGQDLQGIVQGLQFAREVNRGLAAQGVLLREIWPGKHFASDEEFIRREAWGHHACGTCKIGKRSDPLAVVGEDFRVHGIQKLRVVDASIFPYIPGFFIATPTSIVAEKASAVIPPS